MLLRVVIRVDMVANWCPPEATYLLVHLPQCPLDPECRQNVIDEEDPDVGYLMRQVYVVVGNFG